MASWRHSGSLACPLDASGVLGPPHHPTAAGVKGSQREQGVEAAAGSTRRQL